MGYAILAHFATRALLSSNKKWLKEYWVFWVFAIVFLCSLADEYHQSFEITRSASIYDSLIDIAGGLSYLILFSLLKKKKKKSESHDK